MSKYLVVKPGDLVFNKLRTWQGGFGVSGYEGVVSPAYFVCRPTAGVDPTFLHYLLHSAPYLAELTRVSKFMPPSQFDILWEDLRAVDVLLPAPDVQHAIVHYLDKATARIDTLTAARHRVLGLLNERVDSLIRSRIGRSALAERRGDASVLPIKRLMSPVVRQVEPSTEMITAYRDGQVTARSLRRAEGYTESGEPGTNVQGVLRGDIVVHGLDGFAGAIGCAEVDGMCSPVYHVCVPTMGGDPDYIARMLRILAITGYLQLFATSTRERAVDFRNWDLFGRIPVPNVPLSEQMRIGDQIRALRPLQEKVRRYVTLVMEHRQALITAAVTGEFQIPGAAA
jgi:type I restriction enzyme S subunit